MPPYRKRYFSRRQKPKRFYQKRPIKKRVQTAGPTSVSAGRLVRLKQWLAKSMPYLKRAGMATAAGLGAYAGARTYGSYKTLNQNYQRAIKDAAWLRDKAKQNRDIARQYQSDVHNMNRQNRFWQSLAHERPTMTPEGARPIQRHMPVNRRLFANNPYALP